VNKIRTLVVDDEPMARERVLSLLQQEDDVEVVGDWC
jgi:DNA-binding NarL/FixJ family response regulator